MVVNEAMACGRPCVVSDRVGSGPDLVIPGETGLVFHHGNLLELSAFMGKLARDPERIKRMGSNACRRIRGYSVQTAVDGVLQALSSTARPEEVLCAR
jgi:glycosyltransferase involved in cell wall biosynthesis